MWPHLCPWLEWLEDETLFSLNSRHHALSGHRLASTTCAELFGHPRLGAEHDFPSRIDHYVLRTSGRLGSASQIIQERTLAAFYRPYRTPASWELIVRMLCGDNGIRSVKSQAGILAGGFGAHHPLKACTECMQEDRQKHGVAYWHLQHQFPGVWVCLKHNAPLAIFGKKANKVERFLWHLPAPDCLTFPAAIESQQGLQRLHALAHAANRLARLAPCQFLAGPRLTDTYRRQLTELGMLRRGRLRRQPVARSYFRFIAEVRDVPELRNLGRSEAAAESEILRLLYQPRAGAHPLRHLLVALWLFGSWDEFIESYDDRPSGGDEPLSKEPSGNPPRRSADPRRREFLRWLANSNCSVADAARQAGISTNTGIAWATAAGIRTKRRPKVLTRPVRYAVISGLLRGLDQCAVAEASQVSRQAVTRVLQSEVDLRSRWLQMRRIFLLEQHRRQWTRLVSRHPTATMKAVRQLAPAIYAWLYRNDRAWLTSGERHVPQLTLSRQALRLL